VKSRANLRNTSFVSQNRRGSTLSPVSGSIEGERILAKDISDTSQPGAHSRKQSEVLRPIAGYSALIYVLRDDSDSKQDNPLGPPVDQYGSSSFDSSGDHGMVLQDLDRSERGALDCQ
jgi:hypothetical protein